MSVSARLILGLAVMDGRLTADEAHTLARLDEEFQAERWGRDDEADAAAEGRLTAMRNAERLLGLLKS